MAQPRAGQIIRASDSLAHLDAAPRVHAYDSAGNICVDPATAKLILWGTTVYDTDNMHDSSSNSSRITFTTAGLYRYSVQVIMPNGTYTAGNMNSRLNANGSSSGGTSLQNTSFIAAGGTTAPSPKTEFYRVFSAGDYMECFITQTSGANRTTTVGLYSTRVFATYVASS